MQNDQLNLPTHPHPMSATFHTYYPTVVISLCACFLFFKYVLQVYPSIITDHLMSEFSLNGAGLGNLAATFYYSFLITQLLVGILLDKYSTRFITTGAIFCSALGILLFSQATELLTAQLSRALMGIGVAFATVAYMKLASIWFPPRRYAFISGLLATAAMAGAVFGAAPLSLCIAKLGWRHSLWIIGLFGLVLAVIFMVVVRDKPYHATLDQDTGKSSISLVDVWQVLRSKQNWLLTCYSGLAFSPIAIFGGLWGNPFMQEAYHLNKTVAASMVSLVFIGLGLGSPLLGMLSDRLGERRKLMLTCTLISCLAMYLILYCNTMPLWLVGLCLFTFGFTIGAFMLGFTIGKELNKACLTATVVAMINASDAVLDAITEPLIGKFLDWGWDGTLVNGIHYFSLHNYQLALSILPLYLFLGSLLLFFLKDGVRPDLMQKKNREFIKHNV
jgi:MFS family permease